MSDVDAGAANAAPVADAPSAEPVPTAREAVEKAFATVKLDEPPRPVESTTKPVEEEEKPAKEPAAKPDKVAEKAKADKAETTAKAKADAEAKAKVDVAPKRGPDGKFTPTKPVPEAAAEGEEPNPEPAKPTAYAEPPTRFSADAKAAWKDAPEPVRAEVHRATRELEQGIAKYRPDAEAYAELKPFEDLAKRTGTTLKAAMSNYVGMEQALRRDPVAGLQQIAQNLGIPLRDIAAKIVGQRPDQIASQTEQTIGSLQRELASLKQQMGSVAQNQQQAHVANTETQVKAFIEQPGHERFEELSSDIAFFLKTRTTDLGEAYSLAERLNPAPAAAKPIPAVTTAPVAQTRRGALSVHGAPSSGSDPATRKPPSSAREAAKRALAAAGIG